MTRGTVVVVVLELEVVEELEVAGELEVVVELEVVEELEAAPAAVGAIPTRTTALRSATAPRDLSSILLDVGIGTPHLETGSALLIGWSVV
jgi:hypothetical protein